MSSIRRIIFKQLNLKDLKKLTKLSAAVIFCMVCLSSQNALAQWTEINVFTGSRGYDGAYFVVQTRLEVVKAGKKNRIRLRTGSMKLKEFRGYSLSTSVTFKDCVAGKITERKMPNIRSAQIGVEPFDRINSTAWGTFKIDVYVDYKGKDGKIIRGLVFDILTFKSVGENNFYLSEPIGENVDVHSVKFNGGPKLVSFSADESLVEPAIEKFVRQREGQAKQECENKEPKKPDDNALDNLKKKLSAESNMKPSAKTNADDYWRGGEGKSAATKGGNDNSDFWRGGEGFDKSKDDGGNSSGVTVGVDKSTRKMYLKNANGEIIREWEADAYYDLQKLDENGDYFIITNWKKRTGFKGGNLLSIIDKRGNTLRIDNQETFEGVSKRDGGGYNVSIRSTESYYNDEFTDAAPDRPSFKDYYNSSSEATADVKRYVSEIRRRIEARAAEARRKNDNSVSFVSTHAFNVINVKEITTNSKMQVLLTKTVYKILKY